MIRYSVGIEDTEDLIADLRLALASLAHARSDKPKAGFRINSRRASRSAALRMEARIASRVAEKSGSKKSRH